MKTIPAVLIGGLLAAAALQGAVAAPAMPGDGPEFESRSSAPEPAVPAPSKADAFQQSGSAACKGSNDGKAVCEIDFKKPPKKGFVLVDNISCLVAGERVTVFYIQVYVMAGSVIKTIQSLKVQQTGAAGAGEFRYYTSNDQVTLYLRSSEFVRVNAGVRLDPPDSVGKMTCHISGVFQ